MLVQLPLPLSLAPEAAVCMTRGSWLCCAYRSREDWHVPDFCCPLKHISGLLCGIDRIIMGGEQGQPQDKRGFQSGTAWVSVFTCHYVVYEGVCVCVSLCPCCVPPRKVVGVCVFVHWLCGTRCVLAMRTHGPVWISRTTSEATKFSATRPEICRRPLRT